MGSLVYLVLYLYLHACSARPLVHVVLDKEAAVLTQIHPSEKGARSLVAMQFDNINDQKVSAELKEAAAAAGTKLGNKIKLHEYLKILQNAADSTHEVHKRAVRSTVESSAPPPCNSGEETEHVNSKLEKEAVEDIVVMDYAQPHRKPPIHNRGT